MTITNSVSPATGVVKAVFRLATDAPGAEQNQIDPLPNLTLRLLPTTRNSLVPGTLFFILAGHTYVDRSGVMILDPSPITGSGVAAGTIDYATGTVTLDQYAGGASPGVYVACLTRYGTWTTTSLKFRISGAPIQPASLTLRAVAAADSSAVAVSSASDGTLSGNGASGTVDAQYGIANVTFAAPIYPDTAFFNAVAYSNLPLSADILGLDPVRLPIDGKVPVIRKADVLVIHHTAVTQAMNVSNGQTINLGRVRLARVKVIGSDGNAISAGYSRDLDAGTVIFTNVTGYSQPVTIEHRIEDIALCRDAQINGELALTRALTHNFPSGSRVSSALVLGNLHSRVSILFDQETWTGVWSDSAIGSLASASFNAAQFPLIVTNRGALEERWRIVFTSSTQVNVIGETVGQIVTGHAIVNALAPTNPATGVPYFSLPALGWGAGWAVGNVLRFNTVAANYPVWVVRTILQGNPSQDGDQFTLGLIGDVNPI